MLIKTLGIILRSVKYSESSIIVDIYTKEKGLRSYIISGVRSKNAKVKSSVLQVMTLVDMVAYHRDNKNLTRIKEIKPAYIYRSIPFDVIKGAVGLFMVELAQKTIKEAEGNQPLFDFLFESFRQLDSTEHSVANFHIAFMVELTGFLGFLPGGQYTEEFSGFDLMEGVFSYHSNGHHIMSEAQSKILDIFLKTPINQSHTIRMSRTERRVFLSEMIRFYQFHIEDFETLNAHKILEEVLG